MRAWLFLGPVLAALLLSLSPVRFNGTASEPIGLYWLTPHFSPYVSVCLPPAEEAHAWMLGLPNVHGTCPGGYPSLLKQLFVASPRHPIVFSAAGFRIDGALLPNTAPLRQTTNGQPIQALSYGTYTHGLFAISTYHSHSYDSRYFGPIRPESVVRFARPLLVWR